MRDLLKRTIVFCGDNVDGIVGFFMVVATLTIPILLTIVGAIICLSL